MMSDMALSKPRMILLSSTLAPLTPSWVRSPARAMALLFHSILAIWLAFSVRVHGNDVRRHLSHKSSGVCKIISWLLGRTRYSKAGATVMANESKPASLASPSSRVLRLASAAFLLPRNTRSLKFYRGKTTLQLSCAASG